MAPPSKILNSLLLAGVALCLLQIWLPGYYLTCDGPCHLYNAGIVHDLWNNTNTTLYNRFYTLAYTTDPNSTTTFALAALLYLFKGAVAEKVFLTAYMLIYVSGFCALLRKISNGNTYWQLSVFIFVFTYALSKGFYNFSFSIAFYCWMVWAWIRFLDKVGFANGTLFLVFTTLTFFTHLLPFVFGAFTCGALLLSYAFANPRPKAIPFILKRGVVLLGILAHFILLMFLFTGKEGGLQLHLATHPYRLLELVQFKYIINLVNNERLWVAIAGGSLTLLFIYLLIKMFPKFTLHKYDGFLLCLLAVVFVYTFFPEDFMGRAIIISIRAQLFVFIIIVCAVAYRIPEGKVKNITAATLFLCFAILSIFRINTRQKAAEALADYLSVATKIKSGSVVLPLDFSPEGLEVQGKETSTIANRNAIFHHAAQYMGVGKPLILLDNYEANIGYFPVRWKPEVNPYIHLSEEEGIEGLPPFAHIEDYQHNTGVTVDYVLLWCYNPHYLTNPNFNKLYAEINRLYHFEYASPGSRAILYARNK